MGLITSSIPKCIAFPPYLLLVQGLEDDVGSAVPVKKGDAISKFLSTMSTTTTRSSASWGKGRLPAVTRDGNSNNSDGQDNSSAGKKEDGTKKDEDEGNESKRRTTETQASSPKEGSNGETPMEEVKEDEEDTFDGRLSAVEEALRERGDSFAMDYWHQNEQHLRSSHHDSHSSNDNSSAYDYFRHYYSDDKVSRDVRPRSRSRERERRRSRSRERRDVVHHRREGSLSYDRSRGEWRGQRREDDRSRGNGDRGRGDGMYPSRSRDRERGNDDRRSKREEKERSQEREQRRMKRPREEEKWDGPTL